MHQTDYRYRGEILDPVKLAEAQIQVGAAMERTFGSGRGLAADHFLLGGYTYNDQPSTARLPRDCPAWVARIEKARREIEEHKEHIKWRDTVAAVHVAWPSESVSGLIEFIEGQYL